MGTRLLTGRHFVPDDDRQDLRVVIVDETLARRIEANGPVIGSRLSFPLDGAAVSADVIGVVENVRHHDLRSPGRETLYVPYRHEASREISFVVRTSGDPTSLIPSVRQYVRGLEAGIPLYNIQTMNDYVAAAIGPTQFALTLMLVFAGVALFLAAVGLYGVISYSAQRRTHEIGIRMALGAERRSVVRQVVWNGMALVGIGLGIGIAMSLASSRLLTSTLFEIRPTDPATYAAVTALLAAVSLFACYLPARRASSVDPMESLRQD
jgi:putative ABC transport system permease protein